MWNIFGTAAILTLLFIGLRSLYLNQKGNDQSITQELPQVENNENSEIPLNSNPESIFVNENLINENLIPGIIKEEKPIASCALILGSFTKERNAVRMQQFVLDLGYELFTEQYGEFIRIGIEVPCDEIKGALFNEIERKVGVDPWLHIYSFH